MQATYWEAHRVRLLFGCMAAVCHRLATAPASSYVNFRIALRWKTRILQRVMAGYVRKVAVRLLLRRSARCLLY